MISVPSFAKINLGLKIGPLRADGFHELRTVYQTVALHDTVGVEVTTGCGIEIRCTDARVPLDSSNTCHKVAQHLLALAGIARAVVIEITKRLPVQGGLGAASSNAVATMLGMERALGVKLTQREKLHIAAEVGSDLPLFLIGGTVLGVGRGEEVYPLPDLPPMHVVVVTPSIGVATTQAFARWDQLSPGHSELTANSAAGTITGFSRRVCSWLSRSLPQAAGGPGLAGAADGPASGVPARGGDRAETPLLDLVRAGIENDFERVVFPEYPELREVKEVLQRDGAQYASLSGSGSSLYGLFASGHAAEAAARRMNDAGYAAVATKTLTREEYAKALSRQPAISDWR
ncbi:MAG TPA: 4-(cytidine 5'-diphospho)-2-C-methyl-D-erythritol kinase [Candidatus Binatia bacterium]|nr:4-(cytidine 5'-diphospho)-2-C-methyl-D-erythritol kinase [Candidatus Binatia bacterium]